MVSSYNGWPASPNLPLRPLVIAGEAFVPGVLDDDDVYTVLHYVAQQMHERVEPIIRADFHDMDDWGFNYRLTTNDNSLSCHSSGTAIDYNATRHPFNVPASRNFSPAQITEIRKIVNEAGVIIWGGEWNTADAMHFEIKGTKAEVAAAAARLRNNNTEEVDEMAQYEDILKRIEGKVEKVLKKQEGSREREILVNKQLREVRDELDADSAIRRKLDRVINTLDDHADSE